MLHEILLSLSGHPSPLLQPPDPSSSSTSPTHSVDALLTPPERQLLSSVAHLSSLHANLRTSSAHIATTHPSTICRAVATAVDAVHLAAFQRKVLDVEESILRKDAALVGAYNIVPLTAVVSGFEDWTRRLEWLWHLTRIMVGEVEIDGDHGAEGDVAEGGVTRSKSSPTPCPGSKLIDWLCHELQTGYIDVEETARSLITVAEIAWLKQVSAWICYGRLPSFGCDDFFVKKTETNGGEEYTCAWDLLPSFVTPLTAASMLFIGRSLHQIREKQLGDSTLHRADHLSSQLSRLEKLSYPLDSATFSRTIDAIRLYLSKNVLQKLLPLDKVLDMLHLLRNFFLLGRGEFAMALIQQADEKLRSRWRRSEKLAYSGDHNQDRGTINIKDGEVANVLSKTWAALGSMQGQHAGGGGDEEEEEEDEGLETARDLLRLVLKSAPPGASSSSMGRESRHIATTPFNSLLFSVPVEMTLRIPSPLDLFLRRSDLQTYSVINAYLISIRRAHLRLTDLWKITPLRRHHPPPPTSTTAGKSRDTTIHLRERNSKRFDRLRSAWVTSSAAIFFLSETEVYLQTEVVAGLWDGFQCWLTGRPDTRNFGHRSRQQPRPQTWQAEKKMDNAKSDAEEEDIWLAEETAKLLNSTCPPTAKQQQRQQQLHDPQTIATAHRRYLAALTSRLLLTYQTFTDPLHNLLVHVDRLVGFMRRLNTIWVGADLESDAFVDRVNDEQIVCADIRATEHHIKRAIVCIIGELRRLESGTALVNHDDAPLLDRLDDGVDVAETLDEGGAAAIGYGSARPREQGRYVPRKVGGVERLLMKLDFGGWFDFDGVKGQVSSRVIRKDG